MTVSTRSAFITPLVSLALASAGCLAVPPAAQAQAPKAASAQSGGMGLAPAQRARADARQAQFQKDVAALRADPKMTDAQKQAKYTTLYAAMDKDMLAILSPAQRTQVLKQRQINLKFQQDVAALKDNKALTPAQKQARYLQLVQSARNASLAVLTPAQRAVALQRQQQQAATGAQAKLLSQQLQKSETPAQSEKLRTIALTTGSKIQAIIADKTLSDAAKTAQINSLRQNALSRDLVLLTPSQRAIYSRLQALITAPAARR